MRTIWIWFSASALAALVLLGTLVLVRASVIDRAWLVVAGALCFAPTPIALGVLLGNRRRVIHAARRWEYQLCRECAYPISSGTDDLYTCPECGTTQSISQTVSYWRRIAA
ncbi:MAG: hypothetical protein KF691_04015 [Phycisphaeraceae bacterium]|nr:hypothetical protein [Phycisphaeraceae bacterium]